MIDETNLDDGPLEITMEMWDKFDTEISPQLIVDSNNKFNSICSMLQDRAPDLWDAIKNCDCKHSERTTAICTDDHTIWFNPHFWTDHDDEELLHCLAFISQIVVDNVNELTNEVNDPDYYVWSITCNLIANRRILNRNIGKLPHKGAFITSIQAEQTHIELYERLLKMGREKMTEAVWPLEINC